MKLAVVSTILIRELLTAGICAADSENEMEEPVFSEYVHIAHSYAREIEHSDENLKKLEEMFSHDEAFRLLNILAGLRDMDCIQEHVLL
jgi:lysine-N-methylase